MFWAIYTMVGAGVGMALYNAVSDNPEYDPPAQIAAGIISAVFWPYFVAQLGVARLVD